MILKLPSNPSHFMMKSLERDIHLDEKRLKIPFTSLLAPADVQKLDSL